jgi:hypothetical protein
MKRERGLRVLDICLFVAAFAPIQLRADEPQQPPQRIAAKGFSLVAPSDVGWKTPRIDASWIRVEKFGDGPDETFFVDARLVQLPRFTTSEEFRRIVGEGAVAYTNQARFKGIRSDLSLDSSKNALCVRSYGVVEDRAAQRKSGRTGVMILEIAALNCAYPGMPQVGVSVVYSHRHQPGGADPHFLDRSSELFKSVEFGAL